MDGERGTRSQPDVARGRAAARALDWKTAHSALSRADQVRALDADDLELLATATFLRGDVDACLDALRRAVLSHERERFARVSRLAEEAIL